MPRSAVVPVPTTTSSILSPEAVVVEDPDEADAPAGVDKVVGEDVALTPSEEDVLEVLLLVELC